MLRGVGVRPIVKALGALILAVTLWQVFVASAFLQLRSDSLATVPSRDLIAIAVPYRTDNVRLTLTTGAGSSKALLEIYLLVEGTVDKPAQAAQIVLLGDSARSVKACGSSEVSIQAGTNQEALSPPLKQLVRQHLRNLLLAKNEQAGQSNLFPTAQEVADLAAGETFSVVTLDIMPSVYRSANEQGEIVESSRLLLNTTCSLDASKFWTAQAPDVRLTSPVFAVSTPSEGGSLSGFLAGTQVATGVDYSVLRATRSSQQNISSDILSWTWSPTSWSGDDGWNQASDDGLSAILRSAREDRRVQNELFLAGVALGLIGSLAITVLNLAVDVFAVIFGSVLAKFRARRAGGANESPPPESAT